MANTVLEYLNEHANLHAVSQVMVFDDDSLDVQFKDKSCIQLSACGANYQFIRCVVGAPTHPDSNNVIRQRCSFATSETKAKVEFAIKWRNHFAERPYIPIQFSHLCDGGILHLHKHVTSFEWPDQANVSDTSLNCVTVEAKDEFCKLTLNRNLNYVSVDHLVKVSSSISESETSHENKAHSTTSSLKNVSEEGQIVLEKLNRRRYVWNKHIFPVSCCPTYWKYPLAVAMQCLDPQEDDPFLKLINASHAPCPLPNVCKKQFEHIWRMGTDLNNSDQSFPYTSEGHKNTFQAKSLKVLWNNGVVYWIRASSQERDTGDKMQAIIKKIHPVVETWLADGSILNSTSSTNYYFTHLMYHTDGNTKSPVQRMYSPTALPAVTELKTVILRAIRLRSYAEQQLKQLNHSSDLKKCWQSSLMGFGIGFVNTSQAKDTEVDDFEEVNEVVDIPELGKFIAIGGSVQVCFKDGTTAYVAISKMQLEALKKSQECSSSLSCRVLTADGHHTICNNLFNSEGCLSVYLNPMCDWLMWLSSSRNNRLENPFYSDSIFSPEKLNMISTELERIDRFNYLLEQNVNLSNSLNDSKNTPSSFDGSVDGGVSSTRNFEDNSNINSPTPLSHASHEVTDALKHTGQAINDIDHIIKKLRKLN